MKKVIFLGVLGGLVLIAIFLFRNSGKSKNARLEQLTEEKRELQKDLKNAREQLTSLEVENESLNQYLDEDVQAQYIETTFPQDGNFYRADEDFKFYTDPEFSKEVEGQAVIISPEVDEKIPDEEDAYCVCLSNEGLLFSKSWPELYIDNN